MSLMLLIMIMHLSKYIQCDICPVLVHTLSLIHGSTRSYSEQIQNPIPPGHLPKCKTTKRRHQYHSKHLISHFSGCLCCNIFQSKTLLILEISSVRQPRTSESTILSWQHILARAISFDKALRPVVAHHPISWSVRPSSFDNLNFRQKFCNNAS